MEITIRDHRDYNVVTPNLSYKPRKRKNNRKNNKSRKNFTQVIEFFEFGIKKVRKIYHTNKI